MSGKGLGGNSVIFLLYKLILLNLIRKGIVVQTNLFVCAPCAFLIIIWFAYCCRRRDHPGMLHLWNPGTFIGLSSGYIMGLTLI